MLAVQDALQRWRWVRHKRCKSCPAAHAGARMRKTCATVVCLQPQLLGVAHAWPCASLDPDRARVAPRSHHDLHLDAQAVRCP